MKIKGLIFFDIDGGAHTRRNFGPLSRVRGYRIP